MLFRDLAEQGLAIAPEADAPGELVDGQRILPDEFREGAPDQPQHYLELERAVLAVAEPHAEPGVGGVLGADVRDAEAITPDRHGTIGVGSYRPGRCGQAFAERAQRQAG